jgi:hypothetical protein
MHEASLLTIRESVARPIFVRAYSSRIPGNTLFGKIPIPPRKRAELEKCFAMILAQNEIPATTYRQPLVGQFEGYGLQPVRKSSSTNAGFSP